MDDLDVQDPERDTVGDAPAAGTDESAPRPLRVLHVEDDDDDAALVARELAREGRSADIVRVKDRDALVTALGEGDWDVVLSDHDLGMYSSEEVLSLVRAGNPGLPVILVSGQIGEEAAVAAMHAGADDYVPKHRLRMLLPAIDRARKSAAEARERRRAEAEVHKREAQLSQAQALAHLGSFEWAPGGRAVWSDELFRILGHDPRTTEADTRLLIEHVVEEDRAVVGAALEATAHAGGPAADLQFRFVRHDGEERWGALHAEPLRVTDPDADDGEVRVVGALQDITDRKRAEEAIERSMRQMAQNDKLAALGTMMASVGHEINNPLSFLIMNEEVLRRKVDLLLGTDLPDEAATVLSSMVRTLESNADGMARIRDIAEALKLAAKPVGEERTENDLCGLVADALPLVSLKAKQKDVVLETGLGGAFRVHVNRTAITQIVMNLVANAIDSTPEGSRVRIDVRAHGGGVRCVVEDEGAGVPEDLTERIFDPFFTTKDAGTGLGLAISRDLAEAHGGGLWCEPGAVGARFVLELPLDGAAATHRRKDTLMEPGPVSEAAGLR